MMTAPTDITENMTTEGFVEVPSVCGCASVWINATGRTSEGKGGTEIYRPIGVIEEELNMLEEEAVAIDKEVKSILEKLGK
ncbi:MAG: hypothetical protein Kow00127_21570 [Bacteroidales bacterium]